jgi:RHS repeat-associated protein
MVMPQRSITSGSYRYGFNGKENDNEVKGTGNQQDYGMRIYDPRVGRFLSVDPIANEYPELTPYQYASNTPIQAIDLDGLESWSINDPHAKLKRDVEAKLSMLQNPKPKPISFLSINQTRIGPAPPPSEYSRKLREQKLEEYYRNQSLARANVTDPVAAHVGFGLTNTAGQMAKAPLDHSIGTYEGLRDGDYWKAGKNAAFLALDLYAAAGGVRALAGTETYYRAMSQADFAIMQKTGNIPATAETFISPTAAYSAKYEGVLVEINTKSGTFNQLRQVGVADPTQPMTAGLKLGKVETGWNSSKAFFKQEAGQVNIGLGQGKALEIFNKNIKSFKKIERPTP